LQEKERQVDEHKNRLMVAEALEKATALGTSNQLDKAKALLEDTKKRLGQSVSGETLFTKQLQKDIETAIQSISTKAG